MEFAFKKKVKDPTPKPASGKSEKGRAGISKDETSSPGPLFKQNTPPPSVQEKPLFPATSEENLEDHRYIEPTYQPPIRPKNQPSFEEMHKDEEDDSSPERESIPPPKQASSRTPPPKYTTPEAYAKDSATFSSELGTDWIDRYARGHVNRLPDRAGLGVRFWAGCLDWMFLIAVIFVALLIGKLFITVFIDAPLTAGQALRVLSLPVGGFWFVLVVIYFTFFTAFTGQTPGYTIMGIRVVDFNESSSPGLAKAFIRTIIYIGGLIPFGFGTLMALKNEGRLTLHDKYSGTKVVPLLKI